MAALGGKQEVRMVYNGRAGDGSDRGESSTVPPVSCSQPHLSMPAPPGQPSATGTPRSRREALARDAVTGATSGAAVPAVPRSRSPLPVSGEMLLDTPPVHRRGHLVTGPLQVSASMQRLRVKLAELADLSERPRLDSVAGGPAAVLDTGTDAAAADAAAADDTDTDAAGLTRTGWADRARELAQPSRRRSDRARRPSTGWEGPGNGNSGHGGVLRPWRSGSGSAEDGPAGTGSRRQLVTLALALGGLSLTGWAAVKVTSGVGVTSADDAAGKEPARSWSASHSNASSASRSPAGAVDPSIMLGYGEIDHQHQRAFDLLDLLTDVLRTGDRSRQVAVLTDLVAWVRVCFAFEEALMDSYQLSDMAEHKAHHRDFLAQVRTFAKRFKAGTAPLTLEAIGVLRDWNQQHITSDDLALVTALNVRGVASAI